MKNKKYYKEYYKYHKEMHTHYKELYEVAMKELRFTKMQKAHISSVLDEVEELLKKGCKTNMIKKVIELGKERANLDIAIHFDLKCNGLNEKNFSSFNN